MKCQFRASNDQDRLPHADGSCSPACGWWDMERKQSAASKTEEAGGRPKSAMGPPTADEFLTGAGSKPTKHAVNPHRTC
jgi:hypothetical protein